MTEEYGKQAVAVLDSLLASGNPKPGEILVVGCSSSEVMGGRIGKFSNVDTGAEIAKALYEESLKRGLLIAGQCCEHLNRALVTERETAEKYGLTIVTVVPQPKAGGSFGTALYQLLKDPVMVETIQAQWGIDIGLTLIGMHMRAVAIPVRVQPDHVGQAMVTAARVRPKLIGGERARYE